MNIRPLSVKGLPKLLRAVSSSLANETDVLTKELLERSATRIERLEAIAAVAFEIVNAVPDRDRNKGRERYNSVKVQREVLGRLSVALNNEPDFEVRRIK